MGFSERALGFSTSAFLHPVYRQHPVLRLDISKVLLLLVQIWCDVVAHQCEETCDCKSLVTISDCFIVNRVMVIEVGKEGDDGVDGDHDEDANNSGLISC